jgi:hypothetical protein
MWSREVWQIVTKFHSNLRINYTYWDVQEPGELKTIPVLFNAASHSCISHTLTILHRIEKCAEEAEVEFTTERQSAGLSSCPDFCFLSDDCGFLHMRGPLWREDGSVIYLYNCFRALPEQSLLGRSPAELTTIFYCLIWDSPNLEDQVPVFRDPRNRVA